MKVLLIGFTKIAYMPYMQFYLAKLQKLNCEISLIYWNRDEKPDINVPEAIKLYQYSDYMLDTESIIKKIPYFIKFRNYTKKIMNRNKFDLIIVLHSTPGVLLSDVLIKQYSGRYVLDYRDFTYENLRLYKSIIHKLVENSAITFVSSKGYLKYLPESDKINISHNLSVHSNKERDVRKNTIRNVEIIRIRFWGFIRHVETNKLIIDRLGNDKRFELHYHGREQESGEILKEYIKVNKVNNVYFYGDYNPNERINFASKTDLLHNLYENDVKTKYAMGNKYYDSLNFYIPQICSIGSFMGEKAESEGIGIALDPNNKEFANQIFEYYNSIDWLNFEARCDEALNNTFKEYNHGKNTFEKILN